MSNKNILLSVLIITMLALSAVVAGAGEETEIDKSSSAVEWQYRPAPLESGVSIEDISIKTPLASGYCPSNGGNTAYEYICGANYTKYPTGTMAITVEIFIANPTGCAYGDPCPEYDNSPEYVNAWIDWDGDGVWEAHERVIDADLIGYHDLNYYGTMTTSAIVTIPPGSANTTWMRVNLGWNHDPNDPCELSWTWGDVFDERVSTETDLPQIEDIIVTGPPGNEADPMTTFPVTLEAVTSSPAGFAVTSISWSGAGIPAGATGSPYTYTPAAGTHGNKNVQCTITYEKTETGETGEDTMTKGYKLFFEKLGDEDGDDEPNWFEHWATDGAVPRLGEAYYDPTMSGYGCFGCTGTNVEVSPSAAGQHYSSPIVLTTHFGTESFGGPTVTGIDCAAEVVAHEFYHKWVWENWRPGGAWVGKTDSDEGTPTSDYDDDLHDDYENTVSYTWNNDTDTYDLEHKKYWVYKYYGDQEYMAMKKGSATTGDHGKDWANPGKQTTSAYDLSLTSLSVSASSGPVQAKFTGTNSDEGIDTDGDELHDYLRVSSEVSVVDGGVFNIVAILRDSAGDDVTFINKLIVLDPGTRNITLDFAGVSIWKHGVDGIFNVSMQLSNEYGDELDHQYYLTSDYKYLDFQEQSAEFTGKFDEEVVDTDYDKLYNYLIVYAGVYARTPGEYTVKGWLHDSITSEIAMARETTELEKGLNYVPLNFDGFAIRQHRVDGPYRVMELELSDDDNNRVDFINEAYKTDDYSYAQFQGRGTELTDSYESWGKDPNKNKFYDYLTIAVGLNILDPGRYTVIGNLYDEKGNKIGQTSAEKSFRERGYASVELDFIGKDIFTNGEDGPYNLKQVLLIGEKGIVDQQQNAHTTSAYKFGTFQPLVLLTDHYTDQVEDMDGDGLHDSLTVCAEVLASDAGECVMSARLVDRKGKEILWAHKSTHVDQNELQKICLSFDGKYLYASMGDGPYHVSDVYVYHTGDAFVPDYAGMAHRTVDYSYLEFEKSGIITGKVTKVSGDLVSNAPVIIEGVDYDYTNSDGNYMLTILQDGTYTVKVDPPTSAGVTGDSAQISVKVGETVTHDFVLSPPMDSVKWSQPPDMEYGVNIRSTEVEPVVADDWQCRDPSPVADVHFWGSYIGWEVNNSEPVIAPPGVDLFIIRIYEDVPANTDPDVPHSHPGELLYAEKVDKFEERYVGTIPHPNETYEHKFYYSMDLPEPFEQKEGTIYWISIAAVMQNDQYPWGWETSTRHWNDNACQHWYHNEYWEELTPDMMPPWYQEHYETVDMAFELTMKPDPDLGDAPDTTNSFSTSMTAYPGVTANFPTVYQAGSPPHGPIHWQPKALAFLGQGVTLENEADTGPDEDGVNNLDPPNDAANLDGADDGVSMPLTLVHCEQNTFDYVVTVVNPLQKSIYANVWFDWNQDGDWDDTMKCPAGDLIVPASEWAVQNQQLQLSGPGVFTFTTPRFMAWFSPDGAVHDGAWMRITLSEQEWEPTADLPGAGGSGPADGYRYGETEDYYVQYSQPPENAKWVQLPDLTPNGIDIQVDEMRTIADDFECTSPSLLTDVHFWGSWRKDLKGEITNIHLSIHSDDPAGIGGSDPDNIFSKPDKLLWERDFGPGEFREGLYYEMPDDLGEWWWDPASDELIKGGDTQVWRYDIRIKPEEAFLQRGTEKNPTIYWLDISVKTEEGEFGWKTRQWPDHFMDDAVWDRGSELPRMWNELRYPKGHPYHELERNSIDMAFMLTFEEVSCEPSIDVEKKVFDPETGEWVDAITADVGDTVRFQLTIHNDGTCCDLTDIVVADILSESLKYADNAMVNGVPEEPTFMGITSVVWEFPGWVLEPCQTITIEFDAEVVECGIDENIVKVEAVCMDTGVFVTDEDTATVMAGKPELEWTWNSTTVEPDYVQVMMAPVVADLNDDGIPDVIFNTYKGSNYNNDGILRAISGDGSGEIFSVTNPDYRVLPGAEPAVADIDDDGLPEILVSKNSSEIICFEHDGALKWISSATVGRLAIAVADLDQDGTPEIIAGRTVFNNDGTVRWTGTSGSSYASVVADLDLDGKPEVVTGSAAYRYNGSIYWTVSPGGMPAIGNFDSDPYPEIVVVGGNNVSLKEHDGTLKWGPVAMPGGGGNGPPVVADIDGDGELEIGVGGRQHYVTFETNGSIKWMADIVDTSSLAAGSSAFDFDSDGSYEIVYSDHYYHRIFKGSDGTVLFKTLGPSGTLIEQPIIADVDNDGHVEIVFAVNNYAFPGNTGIEVYGNDECWQTARCIWNQHTYHITNINDDTTVPVVETNNWDVFNNYRAQSPYSCVEADVTTVNITPQSQNVSPGPFTVNVTVDPAESINGVQFDLNFNPSLVSVDSVMEGDLLSQDGASTYFNPGIIDNAAGTITGVTGAITTPGATVSTPRVFATIRMTTKSVGTSPLDLSNVIVGDINGDPVSIMVNDGTVTITICIGDVNGDGTVNVLDMIRIGQHWEETGTPGWIPEDVNRDGAINVLDMILIGQHWGPCP